MQAAITLAERGFKTILFEKDTELGGLELLAAVPAGKGKLLWHIEYLKKQLERLHVDVRLSKEVTFEEIQALKPYGVINATGTIPTYPHSIPGIDGTNVAESRDVLRAFPDVKGEQVAVIGGGLVGLETARTFAAQGNHVTLIEMLEAPAAPAIAEGLALGHAMALGVDLHFNHKLVRITEKDVTAMDNQTGKEVTFPADRVVLCMGRKANDALFLRLKESGMNVVNVGDSKEPAKILKSVSAAYDAAVAL